MFLIILTIIRLGSVVHSKLPFGQESVKNYVQHPSGNIQRVEELRQRRVVESNRPLRAHEADASMFL